MNLTRIIYPPQTAPRTKFVVTLTEEEHHDLEQLTRTGQGKARTLTHARILLKADAGPTRLRRAGRMPTSLSPST